MRPSITFLKSGFTQLGGAEKYTRYLAQAFHEEGCAVTVLTTGLVQQNFPFKVVSHSLKSPASMGRVWEFEYFCKAYLNKHPSDLVFGLDRNSFQTHLRASSGSHFHFLKHRSQFEPKWKSWRHAINPLHQSLLFLEKKSFEHPKLQTLFTNSSLVKREILSHYSIDSAKITVIHNGVEWKAWQESFDKWQEVYDPQVFQFLFVGNNFARKGLDKLLHALAMLTRKDFHLSVVGTDKDIKKYLSLAHSLKLEDRVSFHGLQASITPFLQKADCALIPSLYDPFANITVEALAMGVFVITSQNNGGSELLNPSLGLVIEDLNDFGSFKETLEKAFAHPKTFSQALHIRQAVKHLDFSTQLKPYLEKTLCS